MDLPPPPSSPPPSLPTELHKHVLHFCDPKTLARTSQVSLAFLELSSPLLYNEIALDGFAAISRLFCSTRLQSATLRPFLSLRQVKSLTLTACTSLEPTSDQLVARLSRNRLPGDLALPVPLLIVKPSRTSSVNLEPRWATILPFLNPSAVRFDGSESPAMNDFRLRQLPWTNVRSLTFHHAQSSDPLGGALFFRTPDPLLDPAAGPVAAELVVIYDRSLLPGVRYDLSQPGTRDMFEKGNRLKEVVVRMATVAEQEKLEVDVPLGWLYMGVEDMEIERRTKMMRYEVVEEGGE